MSSRWYRANLHTHTTNSDGDSPPEVVVAWYRDADYDALAITDHDLLTDPETLRGHAGRMLLIRGEELTSADVHVNGLGIRATVPHATGESAVERLQGNVDLVRGAGGVPFVNHPNFRWQLTAEDIARLRDNRIFEVWNAGPDVNNGGRPDRPSTEAIWDAVLSQGIRLVGIADDDAHHYRSWGHLYSNPGRAWVVIRADELTEGALLTALEAGEVYASTGVELVDLDTSRRTLAIDILQRHDSHYLTTFIGREGRVLDVVDGPEPRYRITGSEGYVRARIDDSDGMRAWVQPRFVE
jgi:hypothetical protein